MIERFSQETQAGLHRWAQDNWGQELSFLGNDNTLLAWGWIYFLLRESADRREWFPKGKWAVVQILEQWLMEAAREEVQEQ
jgi:hypothetical protein